MSLEKESGRRVSRGTSITLALILSLVIAGAGAAASFSRTGATSRLGVYNLRQDPRGANRRAQGGRPKRQPDPTAKSPEVEGPASLVEKRKQSLFLIDSVLAGAYQINPVEYRILAKVEVASVLWPFDKERAVATLNDAAAEMRKLLDDDKRSLVKEGSTSNKHQRLRFLVFRKVASLNPEFLKAFSDDNALGDKGKNWVRAEWTDEARAIMSVALDRIEADPKAAALLAEESLSAGLVDWMNLLEKLSQRDNGEAVRLAVVLLERLKGSTATPALVINLQRFVFAPNRPPSLQEHFFQTLTFQLRQDIRPGAPVQEIEGDADVAREAAQLASVYSPRWQAEFNDILSSFVKMLAGLSLTAPGPRRTRMIDASMTQPSAQGETVATAQALSRVHSLNDPRARDKEYQKLAADAARNEDLGLAEPALLKIDDDDIRRETTLMVYGPIIRKAIRESDWPRAQKQAAKITDPLGRMLVLDSVAKAMSKAGEPKGSVSEVYAYNVTQLGRDKPTGKLAKAFLLATTALLPIDKARGGDAAESAVWVLNKLVDFGEADDNAAISDAISTWVPFTNYSLNAEEIMDLTEMIGRAFGDLAKLDEGKALLLADGLNNRALSSIARLAIARALLDTAGEPSRSTR